MTGLHMNILTNFYRSFNYLSQLKSTENLLYSLSQVIVSIIFGRFLTILHIPVREEELKSMNGKISSLTHAHFFTRKKSKEREQISYRDLYWEI